MSSELADDHLPLDLPIVAWVDAAKNDPVQHRNRQVTYALLSAIGLTPELKETMLLKGGALMMLGFDSPRGTRDVDFTVEADPEPFASEIAGYLNPALLKAIAALGYVGLVCRVQTIKKHPRPQTFEEATGPALSITIAHAIRGTNEEKRLNEGLATSVLQVDLSFKEPIFNATEAKLEKPSVTIRTYALEEVVAEKFRALLQQPERNRTRRQDVFDLAFLAGKAPIGDEAKDKIVQALIKKSVARGITVTRDSIDDPEVAERAAARWETLRDEIEGELPPFEEAFEVARSLYKSLPWPA